MKNIYIILLSVGLMISCTEFNIEDQGFKLESLNGYVAYNADGTTAEMDTIKIDESEGSVSLNIESPTGSLTDINVNYEFGGDAIFGVDFNVVGATATGGSIVLKVDPTDVQNLNNVDLDIDILEDGVSDGSKTLTVSLVSASNDEGSLEVGRGGTGFLKTAIIIISDVNCGFATGPYNVLGTILIDDFGSGPYTYTDNLSLADCAVDGVYQIMDITGGLYSNSYAINYGTSARVAVLNIDQGTGAVTWSGVSDQFGGEIIEDPAATTSSHYDAVNKTITINWTATAYGERGIVVYTLQ